MTTLHINLPDEQIFHQLEAIARKERVSVDEVIRMLLFRFTAEHRTASEWADKPGHDKNDVIDEMAGSWSAQDAEEFERNTAPFREIDPELWH